MQIRAINSSSFSAYRKKDFGTGRCRLHHDLFQELKIKIGWVVKLSITIDSSHTLNCICTAWPDTFNTINANCICVDDTVKFEDSDGDYDWTDGICDVRS